MSNNSLAASCEILHGIMIEIEALEVTSRKSWQFDLKSAFDDHTGITIGFNEGGHAYLMVDGVRYDGEQYLSTANINTNTTIANSGTIVQLKDVPQETVNKLKNHIIGRKEKFNWSFSCVHGLCQQLKDGAGITVPNEPELPSQIFKTILSQGLLDSNGKPIRVEVTKVNAKKSLNQIHSNYITSEVFLISAGSLIFILSGGMIISIVAEKHRLEEKQGQE